MKKLKKHYMYNGNKKNEYNDYIFENELLEEDLYYNHNKVNSKYVSIMPANLKYNY